METPVYQIIGNFLILLLIPAFFVLAIRSNRKGAQKTFQQIKDIAQHLGLEFFDLVGVLEQASPSVSSEEAAALERVKSSRFLPFLMKMARVLNYGGMAWKIEGKYKELNVEISPEFHNQGGKHNRKTAYTRFKVFFPHSLNASLQLQKEGFFSKIGKTFGAQDIQTGNPDFDGQFIIKGNEEGQILSIFSNPSVQQNLRDFFERYPQAVVDDSGIHFEKPGILQDEAEYRTILEGMSNVVKAVKS